MRRARHPEGPERWWAGVTASDEGCGEASHSASRGRVDLNSVGHIRWRVNRRCRQHQDIQLVSHTRFRFFFDWVCGSCTRTACKACWICVPGLVVMSKHAVYGCGSTYSFITAPRYLNNHIWLLSLRLFGVGSMRTMHTRALPCGSQPSGSRS